MFVIIGVDVVGDEVLECEGWCVVVYVDDGWLFCYCCILLCIVYVVYYMYGIDYVIVFVCVVYGVCWKWYDVLIGGELECDGIFVWWVRCDCILNVVLFCIDCDWGSGLCGVGDEGK